MEHRSNSRRRRCHKRHGERPSEWNGLQVPCFRGECQWNWSSVSDCHVDALHNSECASFGDNHCGKYSSDVGVDRTGFYRWLTNYRIHRRTIVRWRRFMDDADDDICLGDVVCRHRTDERYDLRLPRHRSQPCWKRIRLGCCERNAVYCGFGANRTRCDSWKRCSDSHLDCACFNGRPRPAWLSR